MRVFAQKPRANLAAALAEPATFGRAHTGQSRQVNSVRNLQHTNGDQDAQSPLAAHVDNGNGNSALPQTSHFEHDFSHIPVHSKAEGTAIASEQGESLALGDKSVNGVSNSRSGLVEDQSPGGGKGPPGAGPPANVPTKKAGVDSFEVRWTANPISGPRTAKLRLDYAAKLKKDATHDPAVAEFRQNAFHTFEVTAGPHKGAKSNNSPLHDDNYSRADDTAGNNISDVNFVSNDNPGAVANSLDKDDIIDYSFTAEQMIIDTADSNKVIAKRGPHTATIKGKDPRAFDGVPITLS